NSNHERVVWNLSTGVGHKVAYVLELILKATGKKMPEIIHRKNYDSDVLVSILSDKRIRGETGWKAKIALETGISRTVECWQTATGTQVRSAHLASISE